MHLHLPKPLHGWREFAGEVGIIVLGVLIALTADALIERTNWRHKVSLADTNMRVEIERNRTNAAQYSILRSCTDGVLDRMTADLISGNTADLNKLHAIGEPFVSEAWTATAWEAAVAGQIGEHMDATRFLNYAEAFRRSAMMTDPIQTARQLCRGNGWPLWTEGAIRRFERGDGGRDITPRHLGCSRDHARFHQEQ
jgi:hypothetical protein